ncbi:peptidylprolyl isomerase [Prolixibacter sp. SD074]|uniref:peptidylprolyl isomerase n=1 Tax=Prolixibacter sp. SD074 TaxID=2652391 RepID=UPI00127E612B|nr:peptidylprolyl isomerase [Prolixibacter sp. SD074]GET28095.1 hypothetical protein SD074_02970 [Prolixibacter sp. SD074]
MFESICSVLLLLLLTLTGISANAKEKQVIMTIGGDKIYNDEFLRMYQKTNLSLPDSLQKTPREYLQLFIDFKLTVRAAEALGTDTLSSFKSELARYREESAAPYPTDSTINKQLIRRMYNRITTEVKASHILIRVPPNASPADTLKAWKQMNDLRQRALNEDDFSKIALNYPDDPSARTNKGELGYFSWSMMVYPFEKAAYETPVGQISSIVRTRFGYHIIKVEDTTGLKEFYTNHREKYRTERYFDGTVYLCPSQKTATAVEKMVEAGENSTIIIEKFKDRKGFSRRTGQFKPGDNLAVDFYIFNDTDAAAKAHSKLAVLQGKQQPERFKQLNEVRGTCMADYQDYLEKEWVKQLRQKYPVMIKHQVMNKILKLTAEK